jgi:hypothetical protein
MVLREPVAKNHQRAPRVVVRGNKQQTVHIKSLQTSAYIGGLGIGRQTHQRANGDSIRLRQTIHIPLRYVGQVLIVDLISGLHIQKFMFRHTLPQQFGSELRTNLRFPRQNHNDI